MKRHEKESLRAMTNEELVKHVGVLEAEIGTANLERVTKPTKNVRASRANRLGVAVSKTILRERELRLV